MLVADAENYGIEDGDWVADSAEPSHRGWDPVSGQADYKKLAARIEKVRAA